MKRCPECRRGYYDETLLYCLDDGAALLEGPRPEQLSESPTRIQTHTTDQTAFLPSRELSSAAGVSKTPRGRISAPMILLGAIIVIGVAGYFGFRYFAH